MKPKIIVIGSSNTDMICRVPHIPHPGETVLGGEFFTAQGGKGANQAVAAARAGGEVVFIACVGNDLFGKQAVESYKSDGIDTSCIKLIENVPTGVALINVSDTGENSISVAPGANSLLTTEIIDLYKETILGAKVILMQLEIPIKTVYHVVEMAHKAQIPVVLNPAPAQHISTEILSKLYGITPNEHEALLISGLDQSSAAISEIALAIQEKGVSNVIITTGSEGAFFRQGAHEGKVEGIAVQPVDTTAAGDTFNGYLAVELAKGNSIKDAVAVANSAAAVSVTRMGAQPSIPFYHELNLKR